MTNRELALPQVDVRAGTGRNNRRVYVDIKRDERTDRGRRSVTETLDYPRYSDAFAETQDNFRYYRTKRIVEWAYSSAAGLLGLWASGDGIAHHHKVEIAVSLIAMAASGIFGYKAHELNGEVAESEQIFEAVHDFDPTST